MRRPEKPFWQPINKPRPRRRPRKRPCVENEIVDDDLEEIVGEKISGGQPQMRAKGPQDPIGQQRMGVNDTYNPLLVRWPRTDLSGTSSKNFSLVRPV